MSASRIGFPTLLPRTKPHSGQGPEFEAFFRCPKVSLQSKSGPKVQNQMVNDMAINTCSWSMYSPLWQPVYIIFRNSVMKMENMLSEMKLGGGQWRMLVR